MVFASWLSIHSRLILTSQSRIFVGVPNIAQDKINDAKLNITGVNVLDTQAKTFTMEINSTIKTDGSIHANVDPFEGAMYLDALGESSTFSTVDFPKTNANKHQDIKVSQHIDIPNMDTFTTFNTWFVNNETLKITVDGHTKVKPSGLDRKSKVHFKKTVEVNGLNNLKGTTVPVKTAELSLTKDKDGNNFEGVAIIPNPSLFTLDIVSSAQSFSCPLYSILIPRTRATSPTPTTSATSKLAP